MSNVYCTTAQMHSLYDTRITAQLSNDSNSTTEASATVQLQLDIAASRLDTALTGRVGIPLATPPAIFTKFVAAWALRQLYARRGDSPESVLKDAAEGDQWLEDYKANRVGIPGYGRATPALVSSGSTDGTSRFDNIPYFSPGPRSTGPSSGKSWSGGL